MSSTIEKPKRITKRQQYINGLEHDLNFFEKSFADAKPLTRWHGELLTIQQLKNNIAEIKSELESISNDKNYQPWK